MKPRIAGDLKARTIRLRRTPITFPVQNLGETDRKVVAKLIKAADLMSEIFLRQVSPLNAETRRMLEASGDALSQEALKYFRINFGP